MKTLFITEKAFSGRDLVQKLSMLYPAERFEDYGNCCCLESDSFIVTWAMGHLFRIFTSQNSSEIVQD